MERLWNSLRTGLKDYCRQNGFSDVALGLSGGMDSAFVAVLAVEALGGEHVHTLMMKTKYTSQESLDIARELATFNHCDYKELEIQTIIDDQTKYLTENFNEAPLPIVLENLQARERGKILMAFSNQYNWLVLACNNKSEGAMGYCTLYGDLCGGLSPIGNLYKTTIYDLAKWRNKKSHVFPEKVLTRAPSAELAENQKDEDSLPPYALLDKVLRLHLEEHKSLEEITASGIDEKTANWILNRYRKMTFKRKQMPSALMIL